MLLAVVIAIDVPSQEINCSKGLLQSDYEKRQSVTGREKFDWVRVVGNIIG